MSKFNPTHKTPDGTLLHSEGGKYYTQHAYENFGAAYTGPAEELDAERFVFSLQTYVDVAVDKAAKIAAVNQAISQGQIYIPPGIHKATVSGGNLANVKPCPPATYATMKLTRDGSCAWVTLPASGKSVSLTYQQGGWLISNHVHVSSKLIADVADGVLGATNRLYAAIRGTLNGPPDIRNLLTLLIKEEQEHRAGLAARQHTSTTGTAPTLTLVQKLQVAALVDHAFGVAAFSTKTQFSGHHTYVIIGETSKLDATLCLHANTSAKQKYPSWKVDFVAEGCPVQSAVIDYYSVEPTSFQPSLRPYYEVDENCVITRQP